jgi:hypothetical protein
MKEYIELRLDDKRAGEIFSPNEGRLIGSDQSIRLVRVIRADPRLLKLSELEKQYKSKGRSFSYYCAVIREYENSDFEVATLFNLSFSSAFEPAGEELGTRYDESKACAICGAGAPQTGSLRLRSASIPSKRDFAVTIAGEVICSQRAVELFSKERISGARFDQVVCVKASGELESEWRQLFVEHADAEIVPPTMVGTEPFDWDMNEFRCRHNDTIGLRAFSELTVSRKTSDQPDIYQTRQYLGLRKGLLRPERQYIVTSRFRDAVLSHKLKGCSFEVAHSG